MYSENDLVCPWVPHAEYRMGTRACNFRPMDSSASRFVKLDLVRNSEMYCSFLAAFSVRKAQHSALETH